MDAETQKMMEELGDLYTKTNVDWILQVTHILTEPTCPTAWIEPEGMPSSRYRCDADTIDEAIKGAVSACHREWVLGETARRMVPWTDKDDPIEQMLKNVIKND